MLKIIINKIKLKIIIFLNLRKFIDKKYYSKSFLLSKTFHFLIFGSKNNLRPKKNFNLRLFKLQKNLYSNKQFLNLFLRNKKIQYQKINYKYVIANYRKRKKLFIKNANLINKLFFNKTKIVYILGSGKFDKKTFRTKIKNSKIIAINRVANYIKSDFILAKETPLSINNKSTLIFSKYLYGDNESKILNFSTKKFYYFNHYSKFENSISKQLKKIETKSNYLVNSNNTYLSALHLGCLMGAKIIYTYGITRNYRGYLKNYYKRKDNLIPDIAKKQYIKKTNYERDVVENYLLKKFKIRIINN